MARNPREEAAGGIHHAVAKGNAGVAIVTDDHDRMALLHRLGRTVERYQWTCLGYCLLDNHLHLLVGTPRANLGNGMKWLLGPYAQSFNHRHSREGHLFRGRFYSRCIKTQEHLDAAILYVALNPVRAGVVKRPELWRWSSYAATVDLEPKPDFLDVRAILELVAPDRRAAQRALESAVRGALARDRTDLGT
jgi:putative transposase